MIKLKKIMCESCYFGKIDIIESYNLYPVYHKTQILTIFCQKNLRMIEKFVTLEKSRICGYIPRVGKIDKRTIQKGITEY